MRWGRQGGVVAQVKSWYGSLLVGTRWTFTLCMVVHAVTMATGMTSFSSVCMSPLTFIRWYQGTPLRAAGVSTQPGHGSSTHRLTACGGQCSVSWGDVCGVSRGPAALGVQHAHSHPTRQVRSPSAMKRVANRCVWEIAHAAVSRRPLVSLYTSVARTEGCTYARSIRRSAAS